jgi:hypothetical protein
MDRPHLGFIRTHDPRGRALRNRLLHLPIQVGGAKDGDSVVVDNRIT